jgi:hypothetical protein
MEQVTKNENSIKGILKNYKEISPKFIDLEAELGKMKLICKESEKNNTIKMV